MKTEKLIERFAAYQGAWSPDAAGVEAPHDDVHRME
jgi:hypothetical protein